MNPAGLLHSTPLPYGTIQTVAAGAAFVNALFILIQVVAFTDRTRGWINRPWYLSGAMLLYACTTANRAVAYFDGAEPVISEAGALAIFALFLWQGLAVVRVTVASWEAREVAIRRRLITGSPEWNENPPPVYDLAGVDLFKRP